MTERPRGVYYALFSPVVGVENRDCIIYHGRGLTGIAYPIGRGNARSLRLRISEKYRFPTSFPFNNYNNQPTLGDFYRHQNKKTMKKQLLLLLLTALMPVGAWADEWKDPETNVIYEYDPAGTTASVKEGVVWGGCWVKRTRQTKCTQEGSGLSRRIRRHRHSFCHHCRWKDL